MEKKLFAKSNTYMIEQINSVLEGYQEYASTEVSTDLTFTILGVDYIPSDFYEEENGLIHVKTLQVPSADEFTFNVSEDFLKEFFNKAYHFYIDYLMCK